MEIETRKRLDVYYDIIIIIVCYLLRCFVVSYAQQKSPIYCEINERAHKEFTRQATTLLRIQDHSLTYTQCTCVQLKSLYRFSTLYYLCTV